MIDFGETSKLIDKAIGSKKDLWIRYQDVSLNPADEVITPIEWIGEDRSLFKAFCHLHNEERFFNIFSIIELRIQVGAFNSVEDFEKLQPFRAAPVFVRSLPHPTEEREKESETPEPFDTIQSPREWQLLFRYWVESLRYQYLESLHFSRNELYLLALDRSQAYEFLLGNDDLQITLNYQYWNQSLQRFLDPAQHKNQQLCFGVSFFFEDGGQISPLLFTPVTLEFPIDRQTILKPGDYSVNYAPLTRLEHAQPEIGDFLNRYARFIQGRPAFTEIEEFIQAEFSKRLSQELPVFPAATNSLETIPEFSIYDGIGLFWVEKQQSDGLTEDLSLLSKESHWNSAPDILLSLLNQRVKNLPPVESLEEKPLYLSPDLDERQENAALSALRQSVTLVSSAPEAGKTEAVIHTILQAFMEGKKVLITSAQEDSIDRLVAKLQENFRFPLVARVGSAAANRALADQMEQLLSQVGSTGSNTAQESFTTARRQYKDAIERLDTSRRLSSRLKSNQEKLNSVQTALPQFIREQILDLKRPLDPNEKQQLGDSLSQLEHKVLTLINTRDRFQDQVLERLRNREDIPSFGLPDEGGETSVLDQLFPTRFNGLSDSISFLDRWFNLLDAVEAKRELDQIQSKFAELADRAKTAVQNLDDHQRLRAVELAGSHEKNDLIRLRKRLIEVINGLEKHLEKNYKWSEKVLIDLKMLDPENTIEQRLAELLTQLGRVEDAQSLDQLPLNQQIELSKENARIIRAAVLMQKLKETSSQKSSSSDAYQRFHEVLPGELFRFVDQIEEPEKQLLELWRETLLGFKADAAAISSQIQEINQEIAQLILENSLHLHLIEDLKQSLTGTAQNLFQVSPNLFEDQIAIYIHLWQRILDVWEISQERLAYTEQTAQLPSEEDALEHFRQARQEFNAATQVLASTTWIQRTASLEPEAVQNAKRYIQAVREAANFNGAQDSVVYQKIKREERELFANILRVFPLWALPIDQTHEFLPLITELFDLVIFNDSQEIDFTAAVPLIYRAQKALITGSSREGNQSPQIDPQVSEQLAVQYGPAFKVFSTMAYNLMEWTSKSVPESQGDGTDQ